MFWFGVFILGSLAYMILRRGHDDSEFNGMWATYWLITGIYLPVLIGLATTIWFTIGCWHDMREFFKRLKEEHVNEEDDGTVRTHEDGRGDELVAAKSGTSRASH